jgi:hypothetical protein
MLVTGQPKKNNDYFITRYLPPKKVSINSLLVTVPKKKYRLFRKSLLSPKKK